MENMPIQADFCDAWWLACRNDLFCSTDGGDFFSCAAEFKELLQPEKVKEEEIL